MYRNPTQEQQQSNRRRPMETAAAAANQQPPQQACPRCNSTNTKFCYYNNYSLSQPRYFCKGCRRYWTQGGTLRNVPVGGGCRKSKRPRLSSSGPSSQPLPPPQDNNTLTNINNLPTAAATPALMGGAPAISSPFYGGGGGGFLSSIPGVGFGPNLALLHGLGLPGFEDQQGPVQHEHSGSSFQQLLQQRHNLYDEQGSEIGMVPIPTTTAGVETASSSGNWNLGNNDDDNNNNHNNNPSQWTDYPGGSGLDDP